MKPIIVMSSGGFDSTVLLHFVRENNPDAKIYSLFFDYGQLSAEQERVCARKNADKAKAEHIEIVLPKITWTSGTFYDPNANDPAKGQYLEMRNLIFFSYAISFAQSKGAGSVYAAILKSHYGYSDTSLQFIENLNTLSENSTGVSVCAPFQEYDKGGLIPLAFKYGLSPSDYHSCDTPIDGKPCGKCGDCKVLKEIEKMIKLDTPHKVFISNGHNVEDEMFKDAVRQYPIREMRVLTNNLCQKTCEHCFYGFEEMKSPILSREEFKTVLKDAKALGISNFHFAGKEPLCDGLVFDLAEYLKSLGEVTYDIVTNGILLPKYIGRINDLGFNNLFISIDSLEDITPHGYGHSVKLEMLDCLKNNKVPVTVFYDLSNDNYGKADTVIEMLNYHYDITSFYVRTVLPVGHGKNVKRLDIKNLKKVYDNLFKVCVDNPQIKVELSIQRHYSYGLEKEGFNVFAFSPYILENFIFSTELFCCRYLGNITLTPDGYILGCGTEVSSADYDKLGAGNVRNYSLKDIITHGKIKNIVGNIQAKNNLKLCPKTY